MFFVNCADVSKSCCAQLNSSVSENSTHHVLLIFLYGTNGEPALAINMFMLLKLVVFQIFF